MKLFNIISFLLIFQYSNAQENAMNIGISYLNINTNQSSNITFDIGIDVYNYYLDIGTNYSIPKEYNFGKHNTEIFLFNIGYKLDIKYLSKYRWRNIYFIPTLGFVISKDVYKFDNYYMADNAVWYPNFRIISKIYFYDKIGFIIGFGNIELIKLGFCVNLNKINL